MEDIDSERKSEIPGPAVGPNISGIISSINEKLEALRSQYESQLEGLRSEMEGRRGPGSDDDSSGAGGTGGLRERYQEVTDELGRNLPGDQKEKLDTLMSDMDKSYQQQIDSMHQQHVNGVDEQVKAMRSTLEEIYNGQLDLVKSELEQTHQVALSELQEKLDKEHKEEVNKVVQEWQTKLDDLQQDYEREMRDTKLSESIDNTDSAAFISSLNKRLTEEHRQIIQKIEADLESRAPLRHLSKDSQTDSETGSFVSEPVTRAEIKEAKEKQTVISKAEDVKKSLEEQCKEIAALRAQMLGEYEQLLTVRAEVMSSQSEEVGKLQQEMALIQQQYEDQMKSFQDKVKEQTETALSDAHAKELDEMKQYYENRVSEMEQSYTTDINKLKAEHAELLSRLHDESPSPVKMPPTSSPDKQREYVRKTTTLTVISDEEDEPDADMSPSKTTEKLNARIQALEDKLKEREKVVDSLKKRLEAEATSAEDLHGRLLDNSKTLIDYEDNLKAKLTEIEELRTALSSRDNKIIQLEKEKAALEEQGEKETPINKSDNKIIQELKEKIRNLENELSVSKEANARIKEELNKLDAQHGEAIMKLKEEMEKLNQTKIDELQQGFQLQLEEELRQQSEDLEEKFREDNKRQQEELEIYKKSESELKEKLSELQSTHEKQLSELQEKFSSKELVVDSGSSTSQSEPKVVSFSDTSELDRDSVEAAIRENVRAEILEKYEHSIDKLKSEYEERITELNNRIETFELQDSEKSQIMDQEKELNERELEIREAMRKELAQEFKDKLHAVTDDYENRLKQYQDKSEETETQDSVGESPASKLHVTRSKSLDLDSISKEKSIPRIPHEYEGFVSGIRKDYEDKIAALQSEIAQYRSSGVSSVSSTPLSPDSVKPKETVTVEKASGDAQTTSNIKPAPDAGSAVPVKLRSPDEQVIYDEISKEMETSFRNMRADYEMQLENMSKELQALKESSGLASNEELEKEIRQEVEKEFQEKLDELQKVVEAAKAEKTAAEQKVKADMLVWHEEVVAQLKRKHEQTISQLHKEYEEKMDLIREELQEEFEAEKANLVLEHKQEIAELEDRYDNLVEGLRTGEVPEVAKIVQDKYGMELEMAKTLIQQECDETLESEQSRISEEYEKRIKEILNEKEKELEEQKNFYEKQLADQKTYYEKELVDQRNSLLQQYEAQVTELRSRQEAVLAEAKQDYEKQVEQIRAESLEIQVRVQESRLESQKSVSEESEKDEDTEKVTATQGSGRDKPDKDGHDDGDDDSAGKGGTLSGPSSEPVQKKHEGKEGRDDSSYGKESDKDDTEQGMQEIQEEIIVKETKASSLESSVKSFDASEEETETDLVKQLRNEIDDKVNHYESLIADMKAVHEEEIKQLTAELEEKEAEFTRKLKDMEEKHELEVKEYVDEIQKLKEAQLDADSSEAMEFAHQEEMKNLENRLDLKHRHEIDNLEKQHQSRMDDMAEKHKTVVEELQRELQEAQRALDQYPDFQSPVQAVPTFHGDSTLGSTKESVEDFMVPTKSSASLESVGPEQTPHSENGSDMGTMETQIFEARATSEGISPSGSPEGTLEEVGVKSLETSIDRSRSSLRGVDDTHDTDMIEFSEEESDKSIEEAAGTGKTDRSTPPALIQTLHLGSEVPVGPTVKSLDDTTDSSFRVSEREDHIARIKELEGEVEDLRRKLDFELAKQDDQHERLDREQQEEGNLVSMLRADIDRLNGDREAFQNTNEHLLGLLSDAVKTYMGVEESINKRLKTLMERPVAEKPAEKARPGSAEKRKTPPPQKLSPVASPGRGSPARPEDPENPQETSILSNITDEGLDLSQRISDSIFQGPELAAEEEELLTDAGHRLQTSVGRLLDMIEESTSQLLDTKQTQADLMEQLDMKGTSVEQLTVRCNDLEERLKEEVERKDFLALELHKAEGLIEGYASERELQDQNVQDLEEQKETLVLELETTKNKLQAMLETHTEAQQLKRQLEEQEEMLKRNVGEEAQASRANASDVEPPSGKPALMLEVSRLSSENREKDSQIQQVHDKFESRMRELENSGEDMEQHYSKLLDDRKQDMADMKLQIEALEKQLKSKKQFIEEQSVEREQEHEDYQKELDKWKQTVQDLEKQHGSETRLHREVRKLMGESHTIVEDLNEQLQTRIDLHNEALLEAQKLHQTVRERDTQVQDLKAVIQSTEQELQEKTDEIEQLKQKLTKLEEELSKRPFPDDDLTDSVKSDGSVPKPKDSSDLEETVEHYRERLLTQMSVEEELRQAANRTKEELVREKHALQTQVNENLVQISALRNKLDEMRHRKDLSDPSDLSRRLDMEREKSEEKDKQISDLRLELEKLAEKVESKDHEVEQLRQKEKAKQSSPVEGPEYESDKEIEKQIETLKKENRNLKDKLHLAEAGTVTDMSGLSQGLIDEKNQEIDQLSEQVFRLQTEFNELKAEKGVEGVYDELESLKEELKQKETEITDMQSVQVSQTFTDHSLTPDSSIMNVRASFADKTSIQQEMEEFEANRLEKMASLESEVTTLKAVLEDKESLITSLQTKVAELNTQIEQQDTDDEKMVQEIIHEKEEMVTQLTVQIEGLQTEVDNLTEFQTKLQEDFDTVQNMLDEKEKEIETLTKDLEAASVDREQHSLVIKHEVEIARLKKDLREKDNVVEEKMEEIAEMVDKIELLETQIGKYKMQETEYDKQIVVKDSEIMKLKKEVESPISVQEKDEIIKQKTEETETLRKEVQALSSGRPSIRSETPLLSSGRLSTSLSEEEKSQLIDEQANEIKALKENIEGLLGRPPSPPMSEDEKSVLIRKQTEEITVLKQQVEGALEGRSPSSSISEDIKSDVIQRLKREIERLKQQIMDTNLSEDDKSALIRQLRLENETLQRQVDAALKIRPPSPPLDDDEKSEMIHKQKELISSLKSQLEASLTIRPPSPPRSDDEKSVLIEEQKQEIVNLRKQVQSALQIAPPPPPMSSDDRDKTIELKSAEVRELKTELQKVTQAIQNGQESKFMKDKIEEVISLKTELNIVKKKLDSQSESSMKYMKESLKDKEQKLLEAEEMVKQLEEDLESAKEVKAYEDEIQLQEKDDEIGELKAELESYRSRAESSTIAQSIDLDLPSSDIGTPESKELARSMSFYKDQYEEKCSENRKLQVDLDLVRQQLEKARSDKLGDAQEEIELFKAELERKNEKEIEEVKEKKEGLEKENIELRKQLAMTADERVVALEKEVEMAKSELSKERLDSIQAINDVEKIRERKEKERRSSLKTIQELEHDLEDRIETERHLRSQIKTLNEELLGIKKQYSVAEQPKESSRPSSKLSSFRSDSVDAIELGTDVEILQEQVLQYKKQAEKAKDILAEKQKYQSQVVKLEIQYENLQKQMKKETSKLEEQLKDLKTSSEQDVWAQLQATQERLEKTTEQLSETGQRLSAAESKLQEVSKELLNRESDMKALQQDLWKTSGQLSVTSGKLQETEEKLRLTVSQVTEREEQIHQLQGELQHTQQEVEKVERMSKGVPDQSEEVRYLNDRLKKTEEELEEVRKSLKESVQMSEQQLQLVESKDEEYVKLKLDIQQTIANKDKVIKDQKKKIQDAEREIVEVKKKLEEQDKSNESEIKQLKEESKALKKQVEELSRPGREADRESPTLVALRAQLQNQEEVILTLGSDLQDARGAINEREKEIEEIQARNVQMRRDEADTVEAMHNQIAQLQRELEELRSATKGQGHQGPRSVDRDESPFDQNGRTPSSARSVHREGLSPENADLAEGHTYRPLHGSPSFDDSGHQSYGPSSRHESGIGPGRQSPPSSQQGMKCSPPPDRPDDGDDDYPQGQGQRLYSVQRSVVHSPGTVQEPGVDDEQGQRLRQGQTGSPGQIGATHDLYQQRPGTQASGSPRQESPLDREQESMYESQVPSTYIPVFEARQGNQQNGREAHLAARSDQQRTQDEAFDRDGNLRPRYSRSVESLPGQHVDGVDAHRKTRSPEFQADGSYHTSADVQRISVERANSRIPSQQERFSNQGQGQRLVSESSVPVGLSPDTEKYIQQMRRELLITKTALMQIQRGERLDREIMPDETDLDQTVLLDAQRLPEGASPRQQQQRQYRSQPTDQYYSSLPDNEEIIRLRQEVLKLEEELELYRSTSNLSARDFVQKVMNLKDELSNEHQRHVEELTTRSQQDTESQLAAMRIKYNDEIEHLKTNHTRELENKLQDLRQNLERKHKKESNKLIVKHQEEMSLLKARGSDLGPVGRQEGVGQERTTVVNGHREPMSGRVQGILHRLHTEGVQVLTISELETLRRSQTQSDLPRSTDVESLQAGWENERQSYLSTIQSLKDLLSQTYKLKGVEKDDDDDENDDYFTGAEGSDWRAELLRAIAYVFTKERESLLAELRSHVLSHPNTSFDEIQRLEHMIRTMESHHQDSMDQIFNADRQSMLAEIRDLHAHATIARMHNHEERAKASERLQDTEDQAVKKERQLKRQVSDDESSSEYEELPQEPEPIDFISAGVQLLEFKIQQEKILQDDLRTSLDAERTRSTELSTQLNEEKTSIFDLQNTISALQIQIGKLKESLEREQSRYVSVTNALEEEKSKSLNLSELLESERQTLWRVQSELEAVRQQQTEVDTALVEQLQAELETERERRAQAESLMEIERVTAENMRQEVDMEKRRQVAMETEMGAKINNLQKLLEAEKQRVMDMDLALEREHNLSHHLQQKLEAELSNSQEMNGRERALMEDLNTQLGNQRVEIEDLSRALQQEQRTRESMTSSAESEKRLLKEHLDHERSLNNDLKREVDQLQFDRLEAVNKLQKERETVQRLKMEQDKVNEEIRKLRNLEVQRDQDREAERYSDRDTLRQADREKEEYKMKLHEQELETQRLTQKVARMEEQLSESREKELRAIRDLEHERLRIPPPPPEMISVQTSPRLDTQEVTSSMENMAEQHERWHVYKSQLESMCQSLHYLVLRCRDQLNKATHGGQRQADMADFEVLQMSVRDLLSEVKQLQEMEGDFMSHPASSVNERILRQNEELTNFVARMSEEKIELRNTLTRLEEEIWRYRQMDSKYQDMQRNSEQADHIIVAERAEWAKEKLSLQMALNAAEREIDLLQTDLRVERERRVAAGLTDTQESDKIKIQRLYGKYLRAESFRKGLVYQKKYLLVLLGGFQDTEETTLALLSRMGAVDQRSLRRIKPKPLTAFRGAVRVVIAISRMKYLVKKWRRATRVGSEVVGGAMDQSNGYVPHSNSYSPPRHGTSPRYSSAQIRSSSSPPQTSYHHQSPLRLSDPPSSYSSQSSHFDIDPYSAYAYQPRLVSNSSRMPLTPPKKDYTSTTKYTSPSSGARRKILTTASTGRVRFSSDTSNNGSLGDPDDYINRLENLQSRLGSLQSATRVWRNLYMSQFYR